MPSRVIQGMAKRIFQGAKDQNGSEARQAPALFTTVRLMVHSTKPQNRPHRVLARSREAIMAPNQLVDIFDPVRKDPETHFPVEKMWANGAEMSSMSRDL